MPPEELTNQRGRILSPQANLHLSDFGEYLHNLEFLGLFVGSPHSAMGVEEIQRNDLYRASLKLLQHIKQ